MLWNWKERQEKCGGGIKAKAILHASEFPSLCNSWKQNCSSANEELIFPKLHCKPLIVTSTLWCTAHFRCSFIISCSRCPSSSKFRCVSTTGVKNSCGSLLRRHFRARTSVWRQLHINRKTVLTSAFAEVWVMRDVGDISPTESWLSLSGKYTYEKKFKSFLHLQSHKFCTWLFRIFFSVKITIFNNFPVEKR